MWDKNTPEYLGTTVSGEIIGDNPKTSKKLLLLGKTYRTGFTSRQFKNCMIYHNIKEL